MIQQNLFKKKVVKISDPLLTKEAILKMIDFVHGKKIEKYSDDLMYACIFFGISNFAHLLSEMSSELFLKYYLKFIQTNDILLSDCEKWFKSHVNTYSNLIDFTSQLSLEYLTSILSSDDLVCDEDLIYEIANNYCVVHNKPEILSCVRFSLLPSLTIIDKVKKNPNISPEQFNIVLENRLLKKMDIHRGFSKEKYIIGAADETYEGYRLVTTNEIKSLIFLNDLNLFYETKKGLLSIQNFMGGYLCGSTHAFKFMELSVSYLRKNERYLFISDDSTTSQVSMLKILPCDKEKNEIRYQKYCFNIGLFIKNDV